MSTLQRRLSAIERYADGTGPDQAELIAYDAAWTQAADVIMATMSREHLEVLNDVYIAIEAAGDMAPWQVPDSPVLRLLHAFQRRIHGNVGSGPELGGAPPWPDSPLALPPVVAEVYMRADSSLGLHAFEGEVCVGCQYMVPIIGRHENADRDAEGVWRYADGQLADAERLVINRKQWRYLDSLKSCPLCGGDLERPGNWADGVGVCRGRQ